MKHFFSTRVRVVLLIAVLLAVTLTVVGSLTNLSLGDMMVKGVLTPIRTGVSKLADGAEQLYSYIFGYEALSAENEKLKEQGYLTIAGKLPRRYFESLIADRRSPGNDKEKVSS